MSELSFNPNNAGGYNVALLSKETKSRLTNQLSDISENAAVNGVSDGELLIALGKGRDDFDAFGIFCRIWGTLMRMLGTTITLGLALVGLVLVVRFITQVVANIGEWMASTLGALPVVGPGMKAMGWAMSLFKDEEKRQDSYLSKLTSAMFGSVIGGVIPTMLWGPVNAIVDQILSGTQSGSAGAAPGTSAPSGSLSMQQVGSAVGGAAGGTVGSTIDKLYGLFKSMTSDNVPPTLTEYDLDVISRATGDGRAEIIKRLRAAVSGS
jgi:hypothetical protein